MKTANIINQINAGVHIILETTKQNIMVDVMYECQGKGKDSIPFDKLKEILDKHFDEANKSVDEDD